MAKPKSKRTSREELEAVDVVPDAWPRVEKFLCDVAKAWPQNHKAPKAKRAKGVIVRKSSR